MALRRCVFDRRFGEGAAQFRRLEVRVVAKSTGSARTEDYASFDLTASDYFAHRILERRDRDVAAGVGVASRILAQRLLHSRHQLCVVSIVERSSSNILA